MARSIYIHIPFCTALCTYCGFTKFADKFKDVDVYIEALMSEMVEVLNKDPCKIATVFFGGGTPTAIKGKNLAKILETVERLRGFEEDSEITVEANPNDINRAMAEELLAMGVNRMSLGVQTFEENILRTLGRTHTVDDIYRCLLILREAGFKNINIDLIHGIPGQSLEEWVHTLEVTVDLPIEHVSCYGLKIEENTSLAKKYSPGILPIDDELAAEMYLKTVEILTQNGFDQYEISNFAKTDFECQHNLTYWNNEEYYAFGLSSHWYLHKTRGQNTKIFNDYLKGEFVAEKNTLSDEDILFEGIMLGLRKNEGINLKRFYDRYNIHLQEHYPDVLQKYLQNGLMRIEEDKLKLTVSGFLLSNEVFVDFLRA